MERLCQKEGQIYMEDSGETIAHLLPARDCKWAKLFAASPELLEELKWMKARVETMAGALRRKGLGRWVDEWLSDGVLDCESIQKAEG